MPAADYARAPVSSVQLLLPWWSKLVHRVLMAEAKMAGP
jgi:hypothetical protein